MLPKLRSLLGGPLLRDHFDLQVGPFYMTITMLRTNGCVKLVSRLIRLLYWVRFLLGFNLYYSVAIALRFIWCGVYLSWN